MSPEEIERAAAAAWPATEVEERDGWLLRATPGLDRARSNGALPLVASPDVAVAERWYAARGLRAAVQVGPLEERAELDARLATAGWVGASRTDVLRAPITELAAPQLPVAIVGTPAPRWLEAWARAEERGDVLAHRDTVLSRLPLGHAAFALAAGGDAVGLAVLSRSGRTAARPRASGAAALPGGVPALPGGMSALPGGVPALPGGAAALSSGAPSPPDGPLACGLFCLATRREARGRGLARSVLAGLSDWARDQGASVAYLQVLAANAPAHALFASAGFTRSHGYVHRTAP